MILMKILTLMLVRPTLRYERSYDYIIRPEKIHYLDRSDRLFTASVSVRF